MLSSEFFSNEVLDFIRNLENEDPQTIVLKNKTINGLPASFIAAQVSGRKKAKEKLPLFAATPGIVFPPSINLEQSSSEKTARFKLEIIARLGLHQHECCADLTGGFGVDSFYLSRAFRSVLYVERDASILDIARHNHAQLGAANIEYNNNSASEFLEVTEKNFDLIFIDPSRRKEGNQKVHSLAQSEPDVVAVLDDVFKKCRNVLIKAAPLMDIHLALKELRWVKNVYIVAVNNECKELLFHLEKDFQGEPLVEAINLAGDRREVFEFTFAEEKVSSPTFSPPLRYLFEPNAAILKGGAFKNIADRFKIHKIHPSTHLYTSDSLVSNFPGRTFIVETLAKPDSRLLHALLPNGRANVLTRNYPLSPDELKKKTKLTDGGLKYVIGFTGVNAKYVAVASRVGENLDALED